VIENLITDKQIICNAFTRSVNKEKIICSLQNIDLFSKSARCMAWSMRKWTKLITNATHETIAIAAVLSLFYARSSQIGQTRKRSRKRGTLNLLIVNRLGRARTLRVQYKRHFIRGRRAWARATHSRITVIATAGNANFTNASLPRSHATSSVSYAIEDSLGLYMLTRSPFLQLDTFRRLIVSENLLRLHILFVRLLVFLFPIVHIRIDIADNCAKVLISVHKVIRQSLQIFK